MLSNYTKISLHSECIFIVEFRASGLNDSRVIAKITLKNLFPYTWQHKDKLWQYDENIAD